MKPVDPLQDAGLLCERLKRAGLDVRTCEIRQSGPFVELNVPTRENLKTLAHILKTHDAQTAQAVMDEINEDKPITRREVRAMFQKLREELGGK